MYEYEDDMNIFLGVMFGKYSQGIILISTKNLPTTY